MILKKYLDFALRTVRYRGLFDASASLFSDVLFDATRRVNTLVPCELAGLRTVGEHRAHGIQYQGVDARLFRRMIRALPRQDETDVFVDLGSGKGKALILAAECGFKHIIGVEFSRELFEISERNLARCPHRLEGMDIRILREDAARFEFPEGRLTLFLYNPFGRVVMDQVIRNLIRREEGGSPVAQIVYLNPVCLTQFLEAGYRILDEHRIRGHLAGVNLGR